MNRFSFAALALALAACGSPAGSRQAPELVLPDLAGKTVNLSSFRGRPVLVNFWATWCDTCREEMPALEKLFRRSDGRFAVIGVSLDENAALVPPFARKHGLTFPLLIADRKAVAGYAVRGLPTAYLIDAEGRISRRWVGALDVRTLENDILALLNRRPS
ncbi:MAG: TlpA family protein disulfide reductase [Elusimicrobia bacterium]|nr:TlpA family protein disulfide reductase [Elusimicrobiota bacterium]